MTEIEKYIGNGEIDCTGKAVTRNSHNTRYEYEIKITK